MDLSLLDTRDIANSGAVMHVEHPVTGEKLYTEGDNPQPITITLLGRDSKKLKARQNEITNEMFKKGFRPKAMSAEKSTDETLTTLALATVEWANIELDGKVLPFSTENAKALYTKLPWLAEAVDAFCGDRGNFLKTPSPTPSKS